MRYRRGIRPTVLHRERTARLTRSNRVGEKEGKGGCVALIELDEHSGIPIWVQLRNRLMYLIDSGHYLNGDRLPTVRALAADLNVNYHTVNKVYISLERDGYISSKRGKGAFVDKVPCTGEDTLSGDAVIAECIRQCLELGMTENDVEKHFARALEAARSAGEGNGA